MKLARSIAAALLAVLFATASLALTAAHASEEKPEIARINVSGEGSADIAPDMAIIQLGVVREAKTARRALSANNEAMAEVIAAMKETGIEARDLQTSDFSIQPRYHYPKRTNNGEQKPPKIIGYVVSNNLTVRIRDLSALGDVLDRSVTLGANSGGHIQFTNDDPKEVIANARAAAMQDAMDRAGTLAGAAGVRLGRILEINETFNRPAPIPMARGKMMAEAMAADSVPVESGENTYRVHVSVSWEIDQ